ncbi:MAG TPA: transglycosylase SLT domain-containing protein [Ktedonobacterales bacterium]
MHRVSQYVRNAASNLHVAHKALIVTGALAATLVGTAAAAPVNARGVNLTYHRGYAVEGSWLCYGWANGAYHCTQHWHRSHGALVSDHPSWVPNYSAAPATVAVTRSAPVHHTAPAHKTVTTHKSAPAHHSAPVTYATSANPGQQAIINEIRAVFGPYAGQALTIARCESSFNPNARNSISIGGAHAAGVFQILDSSTWRSTSYAGYSPYNAYANIHAAYQIFQRDGYSWREWQCRA